MPLLLLVAFVVVPLVEVAVLLQVGQWIGTGPAILVLVIDSLVGAWLAKREGTRAWRAFRAATAAGRMPGTEIADGALILVGATLLLTPGFVTDVVGALLLVPPSRAVLRRGFLSWVVRRGVTVGLGPAAGAAAGASAWRADRRRREAGTPGHGTPGQGGSQGQDETPGQGPGSGRGRVVEGEVVDQPGHSAGEDTWPDGDETPRTSPRDDETPPGTAGSPRP